MRVLNSLESPYFVRLIDFTEDISNFYIVTEYLDTTLLSYLTQNQGLHIDIYRYIFGILCEAVNTLHTELSIMHRDLKLENIMVANWQPTASGK
jgi:serine/threonine protein kinase